MNIDLGTRNKYISPQLSLCGLLKMFQLTLSRFPQAIRRSPQLDGRNSKNSREDRNDELIRVVIGHMDDKTDRVQCPFASAPSSVRENELAVGVRRHLDRERPGGFGLGSSAAGSGTHLPSLPKQYVAMAQV
jgi:hypothetical protein